MMKKQLLNMMERKELVELYSDPNDLRKFDVVRILKVSDAFLVAANMASNGMYDGYRLLYVDNIHQMNIQTKYIKKIKKLYQAKKQSHLDFVDENDDLLLSFLDFAHKHNFMVSVDLLNVPGEVQGFIKHLEADIFVISMVDDMGELDGEAFIRFGAIHGMSCDGQDVSDLMRIYSGIGK
ncbi:hypothetical protein [Peribacillus sp. FSL E2-0218]|uniref:Uncharacterized protein n=2 Tax=Peribacillus simplex TaxID=1478 RepID=A0A109MYH4_9BACI|nr:hypothetical protein AS888_06800 [Peribacillus simplex]